MTQTVTLHIERNSSTRHSIVKAEVNRDGTLRVIELKGLLSIKVHEQATVGLLPKEQVQRRVEDLTTGLKLNVRKPSGSEFPIKTSTILEPRDYIVVRTPGGGELFIGKADAGRLTISG